MAIEALVYLLEIVLRWLNILAAPFQNFELLWIIVPAYISWFFNEFYQEKTGTSFGNAISNGAVLLWVGADWARTATNFLNADVLGMTLFKYTFAGIAFLYGLFIIIWGARGHKAIKFIGRARNITYIMIMFTPLFYNIIPLDFETFLCIFLFFPVYYLVIEILDIIIPDPKVYKEDNSLQNKNPAQISGKKSPSDPEYLDFA